MNKPILLLFVLLLLTTVACNRNPHQPMIGDTIPVVTDQESSLQRGDLLFVGGDSQMDNAIMGSTGYFTHVAIVDRQGDDIYLIESTPQHGVTYRPIADFYQDAMLSDSTRATIYGMRLAHPFDVDKAIAIAKSHIGEAYDSLYLPGNDRVYCSELITEAYLDMDGKPIFSLHSMNFRDVNGDMPQFWIDWYQQLHAPIPEGVLGSNPNNMFKSSKLNMVCKL